MSWMGALRLYQLNTLFLPFYFWKFYQKNPWILVGAEIRVLKLVQAVQWVALCFMLKKYFCYESKHSFFKKKKLKPYGNVTLKK